MAPACAALSNCRPRPMRSCPQKLEALMPRSRSRAIGLGRTALLGKPHASGIPVEWHGGMVRIGYALRTCMKKMLCVLELASSQAPNTCWQQEQ
eukprot:scaffold28853_cov20-Tisochrysis_lutea.AAC.1